MVSDVNLHPYNKALSKEVHPDKLTRFFRRSKECDKVGWFKLDLTLA